jgi:hypothetical protein
MLEGTPRGEDDASMDRWEDVRLAQLEAHKSFALALNALWERNFRQHLWTSAVLEGWRDERLENVERRPWADCFEELHGFPISWFPSYPTLKLLSLVANAVRHGNGRSARESYEACPSLFLDHEVTTGFFSYFAHGGEPVSSVRKLYIDLEMLDTFKAAIVDFWRSIRALQLSAE